MKNAIRIAALSLPLAGSTASNATADQIDPALEQAIRDKAASVLNAPYSAIFTFDIVRVIGDNEAGKICGTVKAKNGFGAYTGKQFFFAGYLHQGGELAIANGRICD